MSVFETYSKLLGDALTGQNPFYAEGSLAFPPEQLNLYFRSGNNVLGLISFRDAPSQHEVESLAKACQPATFGINQKDVLDETYRKAGKLDLTDFGINFDIHNSGLLESVRSSLFQSEDEERPIRAELYKLNVYGPGSFFKSHKDTPRGADMFGTLVVVFPTRHAGGALHLRHGGKTFVHDCSSKFSSPSPPIAWVAFYSDVEHEVSTVESGYRVTLSYNLYFRDNTILGAIPKEVFTSTPFFQAFSKALSDPGFLPEGGTLGFGLRHEYPMGQGDSRELTGIEKRLKGNDALIFSTAMRLGLQPVLKTVYQSPDEDGTFLCDRVLVDIPYECESLLDELRHIISVEYESTVEMQDPQNWRFTG